MKKIVKTFDNFFKKILNEKKKFFFLLYENETGHTLKVAKNLISLYEPIFFSCDFSVIIQKRTHQKRL